MSGTSDDVDAGDEFEPDDVPTEEDRTETPETAGIDAPVMAYSATRFETLACRFRFWAKYLGKVPEATSPILGFGSFVHRVAEIYVKSCVEAQVDGDGLLAMRALESAWAESPVVTPEQYEEVQSLIVWYAQSTKIPWNNVVGAELEYAVDSNWEPCGWKDPQVRVRGRVDWLEVYGGQALVGDLKTHRAAMTQKEMEKSWGTRIYAPLAWAHNQGLARVTVAFQFMRSNIRRAARFEISDILRLRDELDRAMERIDVLMVNRDDPAKWPASPSRMCGICEYREVCPKKDEVAMLGPVTSEQDAVKRGERILYTEQLLKADREALRAWVNATVAVPVNGVVFDYYRGSSWQFDTLAVMAACRKHGIPLEAVFKVDKKALDKVARTAKTFGVDVAGAATDVGATRFRWRKAGGDE